MRRNRTVQDDVRLRGVRRRDQQLRQSKEERDTNRQRETQRNQHAARPSSSPDSLIIRSGRRGITEKTEMTEQTEVSQRFFPPFSYFHHLYSLPHYSSEKAHGVQALACGLHYSSEKAHGVQALACGFHFRAVQGGKLKLELHALFSLFQGVAHCDLND